jgi:putative hydrolase of the HAD superfamily
VLFERWQEVLEGLSWERFYEAYVAAERAMTTEENWDFRRTLQEKCRLEARFMQRPDATNQADGVAEACYELARECTARSRDVLEALRKEGIPLVLVSNFYGNLTAVLRDFGLEGCFDHIVESARVGVRKPDSAIFRLVLDLYPALKPDDVLVAGDSERNDILPAQSLGMKTHLVRKFGDLLALV